MSKVGQELSSVPFGDMIAAMGLGIAQAQVELDKASTEVARLMSGAREKDRVWFNGQRLSLIELGFTPTFYQFIDSIIEIKITVNLAQSTSNEVNTKSNTRALSYGGYQWWNRSSRIAVMTSTVDAKYSNTYDYSVEGSSLMRTKLVPVPPPAILEERIRLIMDEEETIRYRIQLDKVIADAKAAIVNSITNWTWATDAVFSSKNDMQNAFLQDNPSVAAIVADYPEVLLETDINAALNNKLEAYHTDLRGELSNALSAWTPPNENYYNSVGDIRSDFLLQHPSLASKLAVNREFLEEVAIFNEFTSLYTDYKDALSDLLETEIQNWVIPEDGVYGSHRDMFADFFQEKTELNSRFVQHQDIVQSTEMTDEMVDRFTEYKDALRAKIEGMVNAWIPPFDQVFNSQVDLERYFYSQYPVLQDQVARITDLQTDTTLQNAFSKAFKVYDTVTRYLNWEPAEGKTFPSKGAIQNEFLAETDISLSSTLKSKIYALPEYQSHSANLLAKFKEES